MDIARGDEVTATAPDAGTQGATLRRRQTGDVRRVAGVLLLLLWLAWLVGAALFQPRLVSDAQFREDVRAGSVTSWRLVLMKHESGQSWSQDVNLEWVSAADGGDALEDRGPGVLTVSYTSADEPWTHVLEDPSDPLPEDVTGLLRSADVPQARSDVDAPRLEPPNWAAQAGFAVVVVFLVVLVGGPRPTRGTRWFWFWFLFPTLGAGVVLYAVLEHLRWRPPDAPTEEGRPLDVLEGDRWPDPDTSTERPAPVHRRRSGLAGFGFSIVLGFAVTAVLAILIETTGWTWPIRP